MFSRKQEFEEMMGAMSEEKAGPLRVLSLALILDCQPQNCDKFDHL